MLRIRPELISTPDLQPFTTLTIQRQAQDRPQRAGDTGQRGPLHPDRNILNHRADLRVETTRCITSKVIYHVAIHNQTSDDKRANNRTKSSA